MSMYPDGGPGPVNVGPSSLSEHKIAFDQSLSSESAIELLLSALKTPAQARDVLLNGLRNSCEIIGETAYNPDRSLIFPANKEAAQLGLVFLGAGTRDGASSTRHIDSAFQLGTNLIDYCRKNSQFGMPCGLDVPSSHPSKEYLLLAELGDSLKIAKTVAEMLAVGLIRTRRSFSDAANPSEMVIAAVGDLYLAPINEEFAEPILPVISFARSHEVGKAAIEALTKPNQCGWESRLSQLAIEMRSLRRAVPDQN
jgi:hypothetical protein